LIRFPEAVPALTGCRRCWGLALHAIACMRSANPMGLDAQRYFRSLASTIRCGDGGLLRLNSGA
jgi:hypothetical protein